ncbi:MAG: TetR/AcrR family transcriptional regulator [Henriciella sp.]|nr:TetR/AcrR family transcriptional regulator [Hyphomonadaceae bacterium]
MAPTAPKQSRAIKTRKKLMEALERLLRQHEFENISVQDIAKEAGVAVGSVYSHFKDKTAFLEALLAYWRDQVEAQLDLSERQDTQAVFVALGSLRAALFEATKAVHTQVVENGHVLRALQTYARLHPDMKDEDWQSLVVRSFAPLGALLKAYEDEVTLKDHALATRMLGVFFNTIFIRQALMPQDTLLEIAMLNDAVMIEQVTDMAYGYLTLPRN